MSCGRSAGDSGATDDSIDAESFHNGSIGSGGNLTKTHGVSLFAQAESYMLELTVLCSRSSAAMPPRLSCSVLPTAVRISINCTIPSPAQQNHTQKTEAECSSERRITSRISNANLSTNRLDLWRTSRLPAPVCSAQSS